MPTPTQDQVLAALAGVNDPEIRKPITDLGMVRDVVVADDGLVTVGIFLTVSGCPMRSTITKDVSAAVRRLDSACSRESCRAGRSRSSRSRRWPRSVRSDRSRPGRRYI